MKVLDLFAGLEGWAAPWRERGHEVFSVDIDERFDVDLHADILELNPFDLPWAPEVILASPPCEHFSVLTIGRNWTGPNDDPPHAPKTEGARQALRLVERTRWLIEFLGPRYYVIENPRAKLRKLPIVADLERRTVTYCQYGLPFMKPTDLWGGFPASLELKPPCDTRRQPIVVVDGLPYVTNRDGEPCHISAPRGSTSGIQGDGVLTARIASRPTRGGLAAQKDATRSFYGTSDQTDLAALRAKVPEQLSIAVMEACERDG